MTWIKPWNDFRCQSSNLLRTSLKRWCVKERTTLRTFIDTANVGNSGWSHRSWRRTGMLQVRYVDMHKSGQSQETRDQQEGKGAMGTEGRRTLKKRELLWRR